MKILKYISITLPVVISILVLTACPGNGAGDSDDDGTAETHSLSVSIVEQSQIIDIGEQLILNASVTDTSDHTTSISWFINDAEQSGENAASFDFSSSTAGDYTIKVSASCEADTQTAEVIITVEQILRFTETARYTANIELDDASYKAVDIAENKIVLGTLFDGVKYSTDSGTSWGTLNNVDDGLSNDQVNCVIIDPVNPDIWYFGTWNGLSVYDVSNSLMNPYETGISVKVEDVVISGNSLYMATSAGLAVSDKTNISFTYYKAADGLPADSISNIYIDGTTIYAATGSGFAYASVADLSIWNVITSIDGIGNDSVFDVYADGLTIIVWTASDISVSSDGGGNWSLFSPVSGGQTGAAVLNSSIYSVGYGSHLVLTTDAGVSWGEVDLPDPPFWFGYNCNGISTDGSSLFIVHNDGLLVGTVD